MSATHVSHSPTALVLFASTHGHTAKIAARIACALTTAGVETDLRDAASARSLSPGTYDGVVLAGSVHMGRHRKDLVEFAARHHASLNEQPTAFVSVSLTAADDNEESRLATREMTDRFLDDTGLTPDVVEPVAGCLQYREYDFLTRLLMRMILREHTDAHDMSQDHEYTDWARVDELASEFALRLGGRVAVAKA